MVNTSGWKVRTLAELLDIIYPKGTGKISEHTLDGVIDNFQGRYVFVSQWSDAKHTIRSRTFLVHYHREDEKPNFIALPDNGDIIPIMEMIGKLCKKQGEIDNMMSTMGYDV